MGGFLALAGGAAAIASAWLPWLIFGDQTKAGIDATTSDFGLANGYLLVGAGALAAVCGLLLVLGIARSPGLKLLLGLGAIAGGIGVCVVEVSAYMKMNDAVNVANTLAAGFGGSAGVSVGWGIYVGGAAGVVAALGGLLSLAARPSAAGAPAGSSTLMPLVGAIVVVAAVGGLVFAAPQISKQLTGSKSSPSAAVFGPSSSPTAGPSDTPTAGPSDTPTAAPTQTPTAKPSKSPSPKPSKAPTPAGSFWTSGYSTPELAINQFVNDQGYTYGGDCSSAVSGSDYCSSFVSTVSGGKIYAIGGLSSQAEVWVLMRKVGTKWYMASVASATASPPWH